MEAKRITDHRSYKISDENVVKRVLNGEKELFEILMRRHNQTLYRTLRSYLGEQETEDAMQEVWLKAWGKLNQFQYNSTFSTWLIRIGINEALMRIRKKKKQQIYSISEYTNRENLNELTDNNRSNPEKNAIRREAKQLLEQAIDQLPKKYRLVYMLREVDELNTTETANCLRITESNVKVRLHRARSLLKEKLYDLTDGAEVFQFGDKRCDNVVNGVMEEILKS